ncbi:MAG: AAA family ATPase [Chthonomonadales bacterium]|nr:AAA family ATPase [Chthonomonadales bacterium]
MEQVEREAEEFRGSVARVRAQIARVVVGLDTVVDGVLICLLSNGHALLEGVPGLGKTLLVRTLARTLALRFSRIQCTPDLMPADISGTMMLVEGDHGGREMGFRPGPVFANVVLADEINRATPKTQSAMLEAMQEHAVTAGGARHALPDPFLVLATQNPIEMEGTYPLPEAQLDRFMFKLVVRSPGFEELSAIVDRTTGEPEPEVEPVLDASGIAAMRALAREVPIVSHVRDFAIRLVLATHPDQAVAPEAVRRYVRFGASPRAAQAIVLSAKVRALLAGRYNVDFADVVASAAPALRHRILLNFEGEAEGIASESLVQTVVASAREAASRRHA